jgi:hypothetical protein
MSLETRLRPSLSGEYFNKFPLFHLLQTPLPPSFPLHFQFKGILTPGLVFIAPCFQHCTTIYHKVMIRDRSWRVLNILQLYNEVLSGDQLSRYGISIRRFGDSVFIIRGLCDWCKVHTKYLIYSVPRGKVNILGSHSIGHYTCVLFRTVSEIELFHCTLYRRATRHVLTAMSFFISEVGLWVLRPISGLLYQPRMIGEGDCGEIGGMKTSRGNRSTRRKPAPGPLYPPQIPHD